MSLKITYQSGIPVIDSRIVAHQLGFQHRLWLNKKLSNYQQLIELHFGKIHFEKEYSGGKGQPVRYALLTQEQAEYMTLLSRNTMRVAEFKARLIKSFSKARKLVEAAKESAIEYKIPSTINLGLLDGVRNNYAAAKASSDAACMQFALGMTKSANKSQDDSHDFWLLGDTYLEQFKEQLRAANRN